MALLPMRMNSVIGLNKDENTAFKTNRILVVDDEEFCIASMRVILAKAGIDTEEQVDYCITGTEAVEQVEEAFRSKISYKLIFMDFNMPVMDGIEATLLIQTFFNDHQVPENERPVIIGLTGHVQEKFKTKGAAVGMQEVLGKPLYFSRLLEILNHYNMVWL